MNNFNLRTFASITLCVSGVTPAIAQEAVLAAGSLAEVTVIGTTPVGNTGIPISKFAGNVQTLSRDNLTTDTVNLVQRIDQSLGSVNINDTQGSPFQVDLNYRGFTASPALGTPQGLSVFLGARATEVFAKRSYDDWRLPADCFAMNASVNTAARWWADGLCILF